VPGALGEEQGEDHDVIDVSDGEKSGRLTDDAEVHGCGAFRLARIGLSERAGFLTSRSRRNGTPRCGRPLPASIPTTGRREDHGRSPRGCDRLPSPGWPADSYTIVRRVRVDGEAISADPRSRRRRSINPDQLTLALEGTATHAYAVSFSVTDIPTPHAAAPHGETVVVVEAWFRRRTDIRTRSAKSSSGPPSANLLPAPEC
jgi:hypothetical protein